MKSSLNKILKNVLIDKKIVKQSSINPKYWGATITDVHVIPDWRSNNEDSVYVLRTDIDGNNTLLIDPDYELEVE